VTAPGVRHRLIGFVRLGHPFPSLLDGVATTAIAALAGADPWAAVRLGASMVALQVSIGALNDVLDARADAARKPGKPIPAGMIGEDGGRAVAVAAAAIGLSLATAFGPGTLALAGLGLAIGYAYDLVAKGTAWSWLPFALGTPLLPVFAWFGATGRLPGPFAILLPIAVLAGAGLAIANARADLERDTDAGLVSVALRLGPERSWLVGAALLAVVIAVALGTLWRASPPAPAALAAVGGALAIAAGIGVGGGREPSATRRERAWEIEAVGVALLAAAWLAGIGDLR
jgi:4-hydroxybenzoate polyprenyltransferase